MYQAFKKGLFTLALGATVLSGVAAGPAFADPGHDNGRHEGWNNDHGDRDDDHRGRDDRRDDHRGARDDRRGHDRVVIVPDRRPGYGYGYDRYDYNRPDPRWRGGYYAERYYHPGRVVVVTRRTRIYRGGDGRYYCRRSDGTTGLIVGAVVGGALGSRLNRGRSDVLGTLLGAGVGAAIGNSIDRGQVVCR